MNAILKSFGREIYRQGIGYKAQSNRTNARKFTDLSKPAKNACFYCNCVGHTVRNCYYRNVVVPQGLCVWIQKEHVTRINNEGPKVKWVPTTKT